MEEIKSYDYSIWIGDDLASKLNFNTYSKIAILVDENTKKYCLSLIPKLKNTIIIEIISGEENKNLKTCNLIWNILLKNNFDKNSVIINLGGGVICDLGGFCASSYKRGIDYINLPTSLLAMVDASFGGKVGVNYDNFKNQIGFFKNPKQVIINQKFLSTLPSDEFNSAFGEIVKHALIGDSKLWKILLKNKIQNLNLKDIITKSIKLKNAIILKDFRENNERKKLNFGHTFGHAIESYYLNQGTTILHGNAVLLGILYELEISNLSFDEKTIIKNYILKNFKLPDLPKKSKLFSFIQKDKKNVHDKVNLSLLNGIGNCTVDNLFKINEL
jgi:3-dehydroquinate synthase